MSVLLPGDSELVRRAQTGDEAAFEELYRRHAEAAWGLAQAVTRNAGQAGRAVAEAFTAVLLAVRRGTQLPQESFRPKLLAATRLAAVDVVRRSDGLRPAGDGARSDAATNGATVAAAFAALPERWRSALWLIHAEGLDAQKASLPLGLKADATARLAERAREGLDKRVFEAAAQASKNHDCRRTLVRLGAYVTGALVPVDVTKVDRHLDECEDCSRREAELDDLGTTLRKTKRALPAALGASAVATWAAALEQADIARWAWSGKVGPWADKVVGGAAAAVFALGVVAAIAVGSRSNGRITGGEIALGLPPRLDQPATRPSTVLPPPVLPPANTTTVTPTNTSSRGRGSGPDGERSTGLGTGTGTGAGIPAVTTPGGGTTTPPPASTPTTPDAPAAPAEVPAVQVDVAATVAGQSVAVSAGDGCLGVEVLGIVVGCDPPPSDSTVSISTGGSLVPSLPPIVVPPLLP